jgi:hypothetical protein
VLNAPGIFKLKKKRKRRDVERRYRDEKKDGSPTFFLTMVVERKFRVGSSAVLPTLLAGFSGNNNAKIGSRPLVFFFFFF